MIKTERIWILDGKKDLAPVVQQSFGSEKPVQSFSDLASLRESLLNSAPEQRPTMVLCESDPSDDHLLAFLRDQSLRKPPIFVISDCREEAAIVSCLQAGANDYMLKPVDPGVLSAKVATVLLRERKPELNIISLTVHSENGDSVKLTLKEFQILSFLVQIHPRGIAPAKLRQEIWGEFKVVAKALDVHLFKLRRKLWPLGWGVHFQNGEFHLVRN